MHSALRTATLALVALTTFVPPAGAATFLSINVPPRSVGPDPVPVTATGSSDVPADLEMTWEETKDGACGALPNTDTGTNLDLVDMPYRHVGPFQASGVFGHVFGLDPAIHTVCAWLVDHENPVRVLAATSAVVRVQPEVPRLGHLELNRTSFVPLDHGGSRTFSFAYGTTMIVRLNAPATVTLRVQRRTPRGRWLRVRGSFQVEAGANVSYHAFSGRLGGRALRPGRYRLLATARNESGTSQPRRRAFRVLRRPGPGFD